MKTDKKRRHLLKSLGALPIVVGTFGASMAGNSSTSTSHVRCSVNAFSFNKQLRSGSMTFAEMMQFAADIGLDAVDLTGYYFSTYPNTPPDEEIFELKRLALKLGLDISWTGVRNDFVNPDAAKRLADRELVKDWLQTSAKLGAPIMRIFAGKSKHEGYSREEAKKWLVEELKECAAYGSTVGVMPALQHHNDFLYTSDEVIDIINKVDSDWLGLILDVGSLRQGNPYSEIRKLAPFADYWFIKELVYENKVAKPIDMNKISRILKDIQYSGYISFESLSDGDPKVLVEGMVNDFRAAYGKG
jgi:sugar phosphate isomerase/epimerase